MDTVFSMSSKHKGLSEARNSMSSRLAAALRKTMCVGQQTGFFSNTLGNINHGRVKATAMKICYIHTGTLDHCICTRVVIVVSFCCFIEFSVLNQPVDGVAANHHIAHFRLWCEHVVNNIGFPIFYVPMKR